MTKIQNPKRIPTFQKLNSVLLNNMDKKKEKASFLHTQSPRSQRSMLHLWGCSGVSLRLGKPNLIADINIYVFLNLLIFLLWLYNIPWWPDLAAECYTESWRDIKIKEEKHTNKRSDEIVRWGREGGKEEFDGGILFVAVCGTFCCSPMSPS